MYDLMIYSFVSSTRSCHSINSHNVNSSIKNLSYCMTLSFIGATYSLTLNVHFECLHSFSLCFHRIFHNAAHSTFSICSKSHRTTSNKYTLSHIRTNTYAITHRARSMYAYTRKIQLIHISVAPLKQTYKYKKQNESPKV